MLIRLKYQAKNQTLRTLNLGHNKLGDEGLIVLIPGGLEYNRSLHNLGLQANGLSCCSTISLAESLALGTQLHRVDLRKNSIQLAGLMALAVALKLCPTITCLDLDINSSEVTTTIQFNASVLEGKRPGLIRLSIAHFVFSRSFYLFIGNVFLQ